MSYKMSPARPMPACSARQPATSCGSLIGTLHRVEKDFTTYGSEVKFGGGRSFATAWARARLTRAAGAVDTVITNALIVDHSGIYKADIGL